MEQNQVVRVAIVRYYMKQPTMMTEGTHEFYSGIYPIQAYENDY